MTEHRNTAASPHARDEDRDAHSALNAGIAPDYAAHPQDVPPAEVSPKFEWPALSHADAERIQAERARQEQLHQEEMERAWFEQVMSEAKVQLENDPSFREEVSAFLSKPFALLANPMRALGRRWSNRAPRPETLSGAGASAAVAGEDRGWASVPPPKPARSSAPPDPASAHRPLAAPIEVDADSLRRSSIPPEAFGRVSDPGKRLSDVPLRSSDVPLRLSDVPLRSSDVPLRSSDVPPRLSDVPPRLSDVPPRASNRPARRSSLPPEPPVYSKLPTQQRLSPESVAELERYFASQPPPVRAPSTSPKWSAPLLLSGGAFGISLFVALTWLSSRIGGSGSNPAPALPNQRAQVVEQKLDPNDANDIVVVDTPPLDAVQKDAVQKVNTELAVDEQARIQPAQPRDSIPKAAALAEDTPSVAAQVPIGAVGGLTATPRALNASAPNKPSQNNAMQQPAKAITAAPARPDTRSVSSDTATRDTATRDTATRDTATRETPAAPNDTTGRRLLAPQQASSGRSGLRVYRRGDPK